MTVDYSKIINFVEKKKNDLEKLLLHPRKNKQLTSLMETFKLNLKEASLFSFIFYKSLEDMNDFRFAEFKSKYSFNNKQYSEVLKTATSLKDKGMLVFDERKRRWGAGSFFPFVTVDAGIFDYLVLGKDNLKNIDFNSIFSITEGIANLLEEKSDNTISQHRFLDEVEKIKAGISPKLPFAHLIKELHPIEVIFLFYAIKEYIGGRPETFVSDFADETINSLRKKARFLNNVMKKELTVIKQELITITYGSHFRSDPEFALSEKAISKFFTSTNIKTKPVFSMCQDVKPDKKTEIFLENNLKKEMEKITKSISPKNYKKITNNLKKQGFPTGIVMLFYGEPGTGKTASAYTLASVTQRRILQVDISNIRDKFVGESEKRLKKVFNEYRAAKKYYKKTPILLFNEADALISTRMSIKRSVDQMNNTMQNILLEEMENFDGIFIATTNLIDNMDSAFSRRFLYKLKFDKPSKTVRKQIWQSKIPELPDKLAEKVSEFQLTGGQIENIARKVTLSTILNSTKITKQMLIKEIEQEADFKKTTKNKIGFGG